MTDRTAGHDEGGRFATLDILRGIAILLILFMNIPAMGATVSALFMDLRAIGWTPADQAAFWAQNVFLAGTARGLLEMLFGAGMVILTGRIVDSADDWAGLKSYYRRNLILFAFGVVHLFILLWPGDILHVYGLTALLLYPMRKLRPRLMIFIGVLLAPLFMASGGAHQYYERTQEVRLIASAQAKVARRQAPSREERDAIKARKERVDKRAEQPAKMAEETKGRMAAFPGYVVFVWNEIRQMQSYGSLPFTMIEALGVMLIGAGLFKLGVVQGERSTGFYVVLTLIAYGFGIVTRIVGTNEIWDFNMAPKAIWILEEPARVAMVIGHIGLVNLIVRSAAGVRLMAPFAAAGRVAFSLYILQTLVMMWLVFPGFALGYFGQFGWFGLMMIALAFTSGQLVIASIWVRYFAMGPLEWLWRTLAYGRGQRFRRRERTIDAGLPLPA